MDSELRTERPPVAATSNLMKLATEASEHLGDAFQCLYRVQTLAGRSSDTGHVAAVAVTDIERLMAWINWHLKQAIDPKRCISPGLSDAEVDFCRDAMDASRRGEEAQPHDYAELVAIIDRLTGDSYGLVVLPDDGEPTASDELDADVYRETGPTPRATAIGRD